MWFNRIETYKGYEGDELRAVLPFVTKDDQRRMIPTIVFNFYLDKRREYTQDELKATANFDTNLKIEAKMGDILEALAIKFFHNGTYGTGTGDGLVEFKSFPRLRDADELRPEIGRITFVRKNVKFYRIRSRFELDRTAIELNDSLKGAKTSFGRDAYERSVGEIPFGQPSWWLEMIRRIIISEPYIETYTRDYESTAFYDDPRTKKRSCASLKKDKPEMGKAEKFNRDIFLHGECWRFSQMFSLMSRIPSIPLWFYDKDGGDHIFTLCNGWFWDCTGHYLLEDLEAEGWKVSTIVDDPHIKGKSNLYRFTRLADKEPADDSI